MSGTLLCARIFLKCVAFGSILCVLLFSYASAVGPSTFPGSVLFSPQAVCAGIFLHCCVMLFLHYFAASDSTILTQHADVRARGLQIMQWRNRSYSLLSALMFVVAVHEGYTQGRLPKASSHRTHAWKWAHFWCHQPPVLPLSGENSTHLPVPVPPLLEQSFALRLFYLSKFYEFADVWMVQWQGWPINIHFRIHHVVTPLLAWVALSTSSGLALSSMLCNTFLHAWLYAFHGGWTHTIVWWCARSLGFVQLFFALGTVAFAMRRRHTSRDSERLQLCDGEEWAEWLVGSFYALFLVLFVLELKQARDQAQTGSSNKTKTQ